METNVDMNTKVIDATLQIVSEVFLAKVVAFSMHAEKRYVKDMMQAGAAGYILKKGKIDGNR